MMIAATAAAPMTITPATATMLTRTTGAAHLRAATRTTAPTAAWTASATGTTPTGACKCTDWGRPKARDQNPRNGFRLHMNSSITARHIPDAQAALSLIHIGQNWWRKYGSAHQLPKTAKSSITSR
jgi:hypothetical protein